MRYVVIGNSAAAVFGMEAIRETDPSADIVMLSKEPEHTYSRCLTTHYIAGNFSEDNLYIRERNFYREYGIEPCFGVTVEEVAPCEKKVSCIEGNEIYFDRLLIASGASADFPDITGRDAGGVFTLRTLEDARAISRRAREGEKAVVLGAGPVGLKTAYALLQRGMEVFVVAGSPRILSRVMDNNGAALIQQHLEEQGMKFYLQDGIKEILAGGNGETRGVVLESGTELRCSMVIAGKGVKPNTGFLSSRDFNMDEGLLVDDFLQTSQPGIFAAGDVVQAVDIAAGTSRINATWPNAAEQGRLAGRNMAGCSERYPGSLAMNSLEFFGLNAITVGLSNPRGEEFEILENKDEANRIYRRLVFKGDTLVGYTAINDTDGIGALTARIKYGAPVKEDRNLLLKGRPPLIGDWNCQNS